jgi:hypothetical protein
MIDLMPQIRTKGRFLAQWRLFGAAHQGQDHQIKDLPCQDAFEFGTCGELAWIAVADGLGGESQSDYGAQFVVTRVGDLICKSFLDPSRDPRSVLRLLLHQCRQDLIQEANAHHCEPRQFSTTLQVIVLDHKDDKLYYAVVGDGHCIATLFTGECVVLGDERRRPIIGTSHLLHDQAEQYTYIEIASLSSIDGVFVFTDGLDDLFLQPRTSRNVRDRANANDITAIKEALAGAQDENRGILVVNTLVSAERHDTLSDDKTLVMAVRSNNGVQTRSPKRAVQGQKSIPQYQPATPLPDAFGESAAPNQHEIDTAATQSIAGLQWRRVFLAGFNKLSTFFIFLVRTVFAAGNGLQRVHKAIVSDWLPWIQTVLLVAILLLLATDRYRLNEIAMLLYSAARKMKMVFGIQN